MFEKFKKNNKLALAKRIPTIRRPLIWGGALGLAPQKWETFVPKCGPFAVQNFRAIGATTVELCVTVPKKKQTKKQTNKNTIN